MLSRRRPKEANGAVDGLEGLRLGGCRRPLSDRMNQGTVAALPGQGMLLVRWMRKEW